jgi:ribonuclease HII
MSNPTWNEELRLQTKGYLKIAGLDEVGRGTLAGPVMAAAVILDPTANEAYYLDLQDSKLITARKRECLALSISRSAIGIGIGVSEHSEIDKLGIAQATRRAMVRAIDNLTSKPDHILIDAVPLPDISIPFKAIIKGDSLCRSISAASIIAKVTRDKRMVEEESRHPGYGFANNKGYGTASHFHAIHILGPSPIHRLSFNPTRSMIENKSH